MAKTIIEQTLNTAVFMEHLTKEQQAEVFGKFQEALRLFAKDIECCIADQMDRYFQDVKKREGIE